MIIAAAFWDYWLLNHKITVDPINKYLIVSPNVSELNIKVDVFSDAKEWLMIRENAGITAPPVRSVGGDPTVSGEFAGDIYFLQNGYRLILDPRKTKVVGSLFSDDFDTAYAVPDTFEPFYPAQVSSLVTQVAPDLSGLDLSELSIPTAAEIASAVRSELSTELTEISATNTNVIISKKILKNRTETNPATGVMTVYDDDGTTVLFTANIWENVTATTPYSGNAVNRRENFA